MRDITILMVLTELIANRVQKERFVQAEQNCLVLIEVTGLTKRIETKSILANRVRCALAVLMRNARKGIREGPFFFLPAA